MAPEVDSWTTQWAFWCIDIFRSVVQPPTPDSDLLTGFAPPSFDSPVYGSVSIAARDGSVSIAARGGKEGSAATVSVAAAAVVGEPAGDPPPFEAAPAAMTWWRTTHQELQRKEVASRGHQPRTRTVSSGSSHPSCDRLPTVASGQALDCAAFATALCRTNAAAVRHSPTCSKALADASRREVGAVPEAPWLERSAAGTRLRCGHSGEHSGGKGDSGSPLGVLDFDSAVVNNAEHAPARGAVSKSDLATPDSDQSEYAYSPLVAMAGGPLDWDALPDEEPLFF
jgi:hypothetical protein